MPNFVDQLDKTEASNLLSLSLEYLEYSVSCRACNNLLETRRIFWSPQLTIMFLFDLQRPSSRLKMNDRSLKSIRQHTGLTLDMVQGLGKVTAFFKMCDNNLGTLSIIKLLVRSRFDETWKNETSLFGCLKSQGV